MGGAGERLLIYRPKTDKLPPGIRMTISRDFSENKFRSTTKDNIFHMNNFCSPLAVNYNEKYSDSPRYDIVELIAQPTGSILEIGCGSGATGLIIKQKFHEVHFTGLEINKKAATVAKTRLDKVIIANIEKVDLKNYGIKKKSFDVIICADVLEHLYDPWKVLLTLRDYLKSDGKIIASIPNIQNIHIIMGLSEGNWTYSEYGILDATHIRFFTFNEIERLFMASKLTIVNCTSNIQTNHLLEDDAWPKDIEIGRITLKEVTKEEAYKFFAIQYLIVAQNTDF
jgi:2-polyprenyl-3-methyl-5-hydroxy-6-metoxy-1,4-benzoquinol methylase